MAVGQEQHAVGGRRGARVVGDHDGRLAVELDGLAQQRVAIARALASRPTVLFADEPTGNLDSKASEEVLDLLREAVDAYGQTTVMVTHDPGAAERTDRIVRLADGHIVADEVQS